jgi:hypothetical protein
MSIPHPASFLPRSTYDKWGYFDESYRITGDWDYMLRLYKNGASFCPIDEVLTAFPQFGASSFLSARHLLENKRVFSKYLNRSDALKSIAKMYLKYFGRRLLLATGTYGLYAAYRDRRIFHLESSGKYDGDVASMWDALRK